MGNGFEKKMWNIFSNPFSTKLTRIFSNLINRPPIPMIYMIYHLKAFDLCIPTNTKRVRDLTDDGSKSKNKKVQKSQNLHILVIPLNYALFYSSQ